jgi:mannosyltransferase
VIPLLLGCGLAFAIGHFLLRPRNVTVSPPTSTLHEFGTSPDTWAERLVIALIILGFLAINTRGMNRGLSYDELFTASHFVVGASVFDAASRIMVLNNHIGYSVLAVLATKLFGSAEWVLRLPALLLGAAAIYATWRFARYLFTPGTALLTAGLLALSPFFGEWSQTARGYTGLAFMAVLSSHQFFVVLRTGSRPAAMRHAAATVLATYIHLYGIWLFVVQYFFFAGAVFSRAKVWPWAAPGTRNAIDVNGLRMLWRSFFVAAAVTVALYLPVIVDLTRTINRRGRTAIRMELPRDLLNALINVDSVAFRVAACALVLAGLWRLSRRPLEASYVLSLLLVPLAIMWLVVRPLDLYTRFFVYCAPILACLFAGGVLGVSEYAWRGSAKSRALKAPVLVAAWIFTAALGSEWLRRDLRGVSESGYRAALQLQNTHAGRVYFFGSDSKMFDYYLGKPLTWLRSPSILEEVFQQQSATVVYHNVGWNSVTDQTMASVLRERCIVDERGDVVIFSCGQKAPPSR